MTERSWKADMQFVLAAFEAVTGRKPSVAELMHGVTKLYGGCDVRDYVLELARDPTSQKIRADAPVYYPPGSYPSPIVNVADLLAMRSRQAELPPHLPGIEENPARQLECLQRLSSYFATIPFPEHAKADFRYHFENGFFSYGDALVLSAFIQDLRPRRIVEVGSGFSSAVILDTLERTNPQPATECIFIDPNAGRLKSLLRPGDEQRVTIIEKPVQEIDLSLFATLEANDILFLDTSHVLKTGSDVNHELFYVLPAMKSGVLIHFHDIFDGFEYPDRWTLQENRSWNEIYAVRAFLMYNSRYEIVLMNSVVAKRFPEAVRAISPTFMKNPGGSLYLRKL
jgi:Methyltransferase domain